MGLGQDRFADELDELNRRELTYRKK